MDKISVSFREQQRCQLLTSFFQSGKETLLDLLSDSRWHPTYEVIRYAGKQYNARIHELREDGHIIESERINDVYGYQLKERQHGGNKMEFEEITGDVWKPEKEGDMVEGILINKEIDKPPYNSTLYHLEKDGAAMAVWGSSVLDSRMLYISAGEYVRITFKGTEPSKKGQNPIKIFKVERGKHAQ